MDFDELQLMFHSDAVREKKIELAQKRKAADISLEESERKRYYERLYETDNTNEEYTRFRQAVTEAFVTEALVCLTNSCINEVLLKEEYNRKLSRQLVSNFVKEHGASKLIREFRGKSYMLSELAYVCDKHIKAVLEKADPKDKDSLKINKKQKEDFYNDLDKVNADKVTDTITNRVMDSTQEFIDSNTKDKMKIKNILTSTKEKIDKSKDKKNAAKLQEGYTAIGKERISDIRETKTENVFEAMVYSLAKTALKNEDAKKVFVENAALNMDKIVEHCEVMYTFLTTLDTCKIIDVNESYIMEMLEDMKKQ